MGLARGFHQERTGEVVVDRLRVQDQHATSSAARPGTCPGADRFPSRTAGGKGGRC